PCSVRYRSTPRPNRARSATARRPAPTVPGPLPLDAPPHPCSVRYLSQPRPTPSRPASSSGRVLPLIEEKIQPNDRFPFVHSPHIERPQGQSRVTRQLEWHDIT